MLTIWPKMCITGQPYYSNYQNYNVHCLLHWLFGQQCSLQDNHIALIIWPMKFITGQPYFSLTICYIMLIIGHFHCIDICLMMFVTGQSYCVDYLAYNVHYRTTILLWQFALWRSLQGNTSALLSVLWCSWQDNPIALPYAVDHRATLLNVVSALWCSL